jgi:signal transduction histidine kinase
MSSQPAREAGVENMQRMAVIGHMTRGVTHEFNNVLQGILGSLDVTRKLIASGRVADSERFLTAAIASGRRAAGITQRLLECSRPGSFAPQRVDMFERLQSLEPLLRAFQPPATRLEITPCADLTTVFCDSNLLEIAILALAMIARDAIPDGGTLVMRIYVSDRDEPRNPAAGTLHAGWVCLSVVATPKEKLSGARAPDTKPATGHATANAADNVAVAFVEQFVRGAGGEIEIDTDAGGADITLRVARYGFETPAV